ncbi:HIT family protein [Streptomyces sp. NBC_01016]|uniref:HIT family protein n=1 Tax=Streptomyces sp. NBC_01016 TaxID=2903720 RepID=UPI002250038D|nr:HIT family protein [Streptomyces sp. NBC_01016]MCX4831861.1 HIT family protein [Streptomyces sp. NBC_01016]
MGARWPEKFRQHMAGEDCPMCGNDFDATDIGWGLLVRKGTVSNAYLWRSGIIRGYLVVVFTTRHAAEPTEMTPEEAAAFWRETLEAGRAVERLYRPLKLNYQLLGNSIPHAHFHIVPRRGEDDDPAAGEPLPFAVLDPPLRQDESTLQADARELRALLGEC